MTKKRKLQIAIDLAMTVLLPLLMAYEMIGSAVHEWLGMAMFLLFILHHILNFYWHKSLFKGSYTALRMFGTVIDLLLLLFMIGLMASGLILSRHIFVFLPITGGRATARVVHLIASYWAFALMSLHAGLHGNMIMGMIRNVTKTSGQSAIRTIVMRSAAVIVALYGGYAFVKRQMAEYMFLRSHFVFFDFEESILFFLMDYAAMMGLFAALGYYASKPFQKKVRNKKL
ncbi:MAG: DUF4405 domain-containing protein [Lachnospiraceae bacterium]|nr:DUF4405 domain-containing protein [Acetatifactor muris]MCM1218579.1 DUF4405 domain-containing protein [Lachnospiraceae bacterium]